MDLSRFCIFYVIFLDIFCILYYIFYCIFCIFFDIFCIFFCILCNESDRKPGCTDSMALLNALGTGEDRATAVGRTPRTAPPPPAAATGGACSGRRRAGAQSRQRCGAGRGGHAAGCPPAHRAGREACRAPRRPPVARPPRPGVAPSAGGLQRLPAEWGGAGWGGDAPRAAPARRLARGRRATPPLSMFSGSLHLKPHTTKPIPCPTHIQNPAPCPIAAGPHSPERPGPPSPALSPALLSPKRASIHPRKHPRGLS